MADNPFNNKPKKSKNAIKIGTIAIFSVVVMFGFMNIACAEEEGTSGIDKPISCKKQMELNLNLPVLPDFSVELSPNALEMPIGQATDQTEEIAQRIIDHMQRIIDAAEREIESAQNMVDLAKLCGKPAQKAGDPSYACSADCRKEIDELCCRLAPDLCDTECTWCSGGSCKGDACPPGIPNLQKIIEEQVRIIKENWQAINDIYIIKKIKPISAWWCNCPIQNPLLPGYGLCLPPPGRCRSETQSVLENLEKARSGDFEVFRLLSCPPVICRVVDTECQCGLKIFPINVTSITCPEPYVTGLPALIEGRYVETCWYRKPPGLKDCVLRPSDFEEGAAGEEQIYLPVSCRDAVASGILGQSTDTPESIAKICWGNTRCLVAKETGKPIPDEWFCSGNESETEDYFCCE